MSGRGTSVAQDGRYFAQEKKLLATMKFPSCFQQCVDMSKVQRDVINQWITQRLTQLLGFEDEIVVAMAINSLEPKIDEKLDPKHLQLSLTGFLEKHAGTFMEELWQLLLSAQNNPSGIPSSILDKKKQEMESIAMEKNRLKKVLTAKKTDISSREGDREGRNKQEKVTGAKDERPSSPKRGDGRRRSRSLQRRTRSPRRRRRSPSPHRRRRSRSLPRGRSRRGRSRSPSVQRRRSRRSPDRARERRSARSGRLSRRESGRRSLSSSSSEPRRRSPSSSRSPTPARRRKDSLDSESGSD